MSNQKPYGWDGRDYRLWSAIRQLPSFGIKHPNDKLVSLNEVGAVIESHARQRGTNAALATRALDGPQEDAK